MPWCDCKSTRNSAVPVPKPKGRRGAPRKHGADFQLTDISRTPDASEEFYLGKQKVRVRVLAISCISSDLPKSWVPWSVSSS